MKKRQRYYAFKLVILIANISSVLFGCKKTDENLELVKNFHGSYEIIAAEAEFGVDINQDGIENTNLLKEMPVLRKAPLELIVKVESSTFSQFWPNQYFLLGEIPAQYDPKIKFDYVEQATVANMNFSADYKVINLNRKVADTKFPLPVSVSIREDRAIQIQLIKTIYTTKGWQTVKINTIYTKTSNSL